MSDFGERINKASAGLRGVYGRPKLPGNRPKIQGVFNSNALVQAKAKDGANGKAHQKQIHATRAKLVVGNILTLGTINIYYLLKGAGDIKKADAENAIDTAITNVVIGWGPKIGLDADKLKHQVKYDMGLLDTPPAFEDKKSEALFYSVYGLHRSQGTFPQVLADLIDGQ